MASGGDIPGRLHGLRLLSMATWLLAAAAAADEPPAFRVDPAEGPAIEGGLVSVDDVTVRLATAAETRTFAVGEIRALTRLAPPVAAPADVAVWLVDGGMLSGDDFAWSGKSAVIARDGGRIDLPIDRVARVAWRRDEVDPLLPAWRDALPEDPEADIVVVAKGDGFECVSCAIAEVSADAVTVVLEEERIPVKRARVAGLVWLRRAPEAGGRVPVTVDGGSLRADRVAWSPEGLVLDDVIRLPAGLLVRADYAAGRTMFLADLAPEAVEVEPFFGGLAADSLMARFFAPRRIGAAPAGAEPTSLLLRPRTTATWRVPEGCRRFRATLSAAGPRQATGPVVVTVSLGDAEAYRGLVDPTSDAEAVVDLDVSAARRLSIAVDFAPQVGMGCAVRWTDPVFER